MQNASLTEWKATLAIMGNCYGRDGENLGEVNGKSSVGVMLRFGKLAA